MSGRSSGQDGLRGAGHQPQGPPGRATGVGKGYPGVGWMRGPDLIPAVSPKMTAFGCGAPKATKPEKAPILSTVPADAVAGWEVADANRSIPLASPREKRPKSTVSAQTRIEDKI